MRLLPRRTVRRFEDWVPVKEVNDYTQEIRWKVRRLDMKELSDGTVVEIKPDPTFGYAFRHIWNSNGICYFDTQEEAAECADRHKERNLIDASWRDA